MCVPVRFNSSRRKSTSNVRGSTAASHGFPFTFTRTGTFSAADIFVTRLHLLSASATSGNARGAIMDNRNARGNFGGFDIRMASQGAEMQLAAALLNPGKAWKEIDIYQIAGARQPHFHQRNEALPPGEQPGLPTEL